MKEHNFCLSFCYSKVELLGRTFNIGKILLCKVQNFCVESSVGKYRIQKREANIQAKN